MRAATPPGIRFAAEVLSASIEGECRMIPTEFEQMSPTWFTEVMGRDDEVTGVEWDRIAEGVGLLGRLARIRLGWAQGTGPESVIVKLPSVIPEMIEMAQMFGFYDREINFYRNAGATSVRTPECYHVDAAPEVVPFVIVMEDLDHARIVDQLEGCSLDDALRVARAAAALHAPLWGKPELHDLAWLPACNGPLYSAAQPVLQEAAPGFVEKWSGVIGEEAAALAIRVADNLNWLQNRAAQGPLTMCHYDLRLDNLLFDDAADEVAMIDFQLMGTQRGPFDLAYFMGWSMTVDQRRAHSDAVLDEYVRALSELGVEVARAWVDEVYRESMLMVVAMGVTSGVDIVTENERGDALVHALVTRAAQAAEDVDAGSFLP
jgi:hypothetical protein